ncbi:SDR family NAD(P)-dependent oxidoreductase [Lysobacter gummosus]|uniref:SDR family NAD(P)-dependent oxidoreductase n=4 Tax=Lysobacter gummosus TaxID=262324 RepID=UPI0036437B43
MRPSEPTAIIGIACRFPGARDPAQFWANLIGGVDSVGEVPDERWPQTHYGPEYGVAGATRSRWCGVIDDADRFDARFFQISAREARSMDPQQRLLLEESWHCLENAAIAPQRLREARTGVFVGVMAGDYQQRLIQADIEPDAFSALGNYECILANRLSHCLGLSGPSLSVNAACASSLVALHLARRALAAGDCDYALVGAANLNLHPWKYRSFSQAGMLSPRGRCRTFDAGADGYVPGDGIGAVLLTGLDRARAGHHRIHAVVRGSATNHVGGGRSITAPSVVSQRRLIEAAAADGGVDLTGVQYVEAHGTGTSLGDPIEVAALEQAFAAAGAAANACVLGSVKSNIGHLEASAGLAGLIKLVLMLRHGTIAPTLHVEQPNPLLELEASRFRLARAAMPWPQPPGEPRRAGLSSFGFGGTNAHLLIEEAPVADRPAATDGAPELFCLSGHSSEALARQAEAWRQWLQSPAADVAELRDLCGVAAQRPGLTHRLALVAHGRAELAAALARAPEAAAEAASSPWRLCFAGADTSWALAAYRRLSALGFAPDLIGFHRGGWRAALDAAGVLDIDADATAPLRRPRIAVLDPVGGGLLRPWRARANYLMALREAGTAGGRAFASAMQARGQALWQRQPTFSKYLREWQTPLREAGIALDDIFVADPPPIAVLALTVALREVDERWALGRSPRLDADYDELVDLIVDGALERSDAVALLTSPALELGERFERGLARIDARRDYRALRACNAALDEVGDPRSWLARLEAAPPARCPETYRTVYLGSDGSPAEPGIVLNAGDERAWRSFVGELWRAGAPVEPAGLYPPGSFAPTDAPTYRFAGAKAWVATPASASDNAVLPQSSENDASTRADEAAAVAAAPWTPLETMREHRIDGRPLLPGACLIESAWTSMDEDLGAVVLLRPVGLDDEHGPAPALAVERDGERVRVLHAAAPALRASGCGRSEAPAPIDWVGAPLAAHADEAVYAEFGARGYGYGARLRTLGASRRGAAGIEFALTANARGSLAGLIEAGFQALLAAAWGRAEQGNPVPGTALLVPFAIERLRRETDALQAADRVAVAFDTLIVGRWGVRGRACVCDAHGRVLLALDGVDLRPWSAPRARPADAAIGGAATQAAADTTANAIADAAAEAATTVAQADPSLLHCPVWYPAPLPGAPSDIAADSAGEASLWIVAAAGDAADALAAIAPDARRVDPSAWRSVHDAERDLAGAPWPRRMVALFGFAGDTCAPETAVLHLCRAWARRRPVPALELTIATFAAQSVEPGETVGAPTLAAAVGVAKSAAREIDGLQLRAVDLPAAPSPEQWRALLRERGPAPLHELAYRGAQRHARALAPLPSPTGAPPLREGGTYVVIGGLGGLGRALARWLARSYRARIVLIGRRAADADSAALTAELALLGGQAEYLRADVCDRDALAGALDRARARFGALHGALHSAVAMADRSIRHLDSGHFEHVYAAKAEGSRLLAELTAGDDLDVLALFSSVLTLQGNAGQANYVAACAYQDALAERLHSQGRRALSIGWGYWGEVGAVADPHHAQLLSEQGIPPIRIAEAEAGFAAALASGRPRVVVARLSQARRASMAWNAPADEGAAEGDAAAFAALAACVRRDADHRRLLCEAIDDALRARPDRSVRVLEFGAGHGEGVERALPALDAAGPRVEYVCADASPERAAFLANRFADRPYLRSAVFDPDAIPAVRGDGFDLVVVDAVRHDRADAQRLRAAAAWLADDGELLLAERADAARDWPAWLASAGLAPLPGRAASDLAAVRLHRLRRAPAPSSSSSKTAPIMTADRLRSLLTQITAAVLEVEARELDPADNFTDLGVDSVLGVELVAKLNAALGTRLEPTVVYDYPTIQALAESLCRDAAVVVRVTPQQAPAAMVVPASPAASVSPPPVVPPPISAPPPIAPAPTSAPVHVHAAHTVPATDDIAVIGMAGRFPGARTPDAFWANLAAGVDSITEVPRERWDLEAVFDADPRRPNTTYCRYGGFLDGIDRFDAGFFRIAPREAERMDPQQRLLLEESWRALEDGGYAGVRREGARLGVFVGARAGDYLLELYRRGCDIDAASFTGTDVAMLAGRVAYQLDATGPALSVDTACSASLVAIHQACQHLRSGEADLALAGGVFVMSGPQFHVMASKAGMLAPGGRCRAFDDGAEGFVPGEGAGMVLLKPLAAALADGDHVYGVIKASGVNQDGRTNGITAPSARSQTRLIGEVQRRGGVEPRSISYVEAHGTGTRLGDPIEVEGLCAAFEADGALPPASCALGSVKTNIGHAATAAGVASLIKVLLAMRARQLPPSLHFQRENTHIGFARTPFRVVTQLEPWPQDRGPRRAAISSFGFSGTNAHAVIEQAPDAPVRAPRREAALFLLSGATADALARRVADLRAWLRGDGASAQAPADVAYSLAVRQHERVRAAFVAADLAELAQRLDAWSAPSAAARAPARESNALLRLFVDRLIAEVPAAHDDGERRARLDAIGEAFLDGLAIDGRRLHAGGDARIVPLPTYPFEADRHWPDAESATAAHPLLATTRSRAAGTRRMLARKWIAAPAPRAAAVAARGLVVLTGPRDSDVARLFCERLGAVRRVPAPAMAADGRALAETLLKDESFDGLIDLSDLSGGAPALARIALLQRLAEAGRLRAMSVLHASDRQVAIGRAGAFDGEAALIAALVARLHAEHRALRARSVDLDSHEAAADLAQALLDELADLRAGGESGQIALRAGVRYRAALETVPMPAAGALPVAADGVYVVSGGVRGLGLEVARALVARGARRLVLLGRRPLPSPSQWPMLLADPATPQALRERIAPLHALAEAGVALEVHAAALDDRDALVPVLERVRRDWGPIRGYVHCAGAVDLRQPVFANKTAESIQEVIAPKLAGLVLADELLRRDHLDFVVAFSSVSGLVPRLAAGLLDYAAVNAALATWAEQRRAAGQPCWALAWGNWTGTGMGPATGRVYDGLGLATHDVATGLDLLDRALGVAAGAVLPLAVTPDAFDAQALMDWEATPHAVMAAVSPREPAQEPAPAAARSGDPAALHARTVAALRPLLARALKLPEARIDADAQFRDLGIDSILVVEFNVGLERWLGAALDPRSRSIIPRWTRWRRPCCARAATRCWRRWRRWRRPRVLPTLSPPLSPPIHRTAPYTHPHLHSPRPPPRCPTRPSP